jgi:Tol biopolymer transport system component
MKLPSWPSRQHMDERSFHHLDRMSAMINSVVFQLIAVAMIATNQDTARSCGQPAVSPNGERIAYICNRNGVDNVYVASASGADERQVTRTDVSGNTPRWTVDGTAVLFSGVGEDTGRVFSVGIDGMLRREVANVPGRGPMVSPDSKHILYSVGSWAAARLAVANSDGSDVRVIAGGSGTAWNAVWSPDSRQIAYTRGDASNALSIWVVSVDGTGAHEVARGARAEERAQVPAWSSDGQRLVFQMSNNMSHTASVSVVDVAGGQTHRDETPQWFPDGRRIAFQSDRSGRMEVWIVNLDGTGLRQLTR